jgi:sigma-54 dependent transcriptional regulator
MTQTLNPPVLLVHSDGGTTARARSQAAIFADPLSQVLAADIARVAPAEAPVLITGESGTGKEIVARQLHKLSGRKGPFVAVNCGALTPSLAEAELFGHQAGAFTGATETRPGWFEAANGGTLFLDEIAELSLGLQVKLLRVLQESEVVRVGARKAIPLDLRVVAASNVDISQAVAEGRFRLDLYYRLNVISVVVPPLRERRGDVLPLAEHFLRQYGTRNGGPTAEGAPLLAADALTPLLAHDWPGNIRELESVIQHALLLAGAGPITAQHLRFPATPRLASLRASAAPAAPVKSSLDTIGAELERLFAAPPDALYQNIEELVVRRAYAHSGGNQVQSARLLGISRNVMRTLLKRFGLISADAPVTGAEYDPLALCPQDSADAVN